MSFPIQIIAVSLLILFSAPIAASAADGDQLKAKELTAGQQQQRSGKAMPVDPLDRGQQSKKWDPTDKQRGGKAMPIDPYDRGQQSKKWDPFDKPRDGKAMPIDPLDRSQ
jgi:hypothetical protein